MKRFTIFLIAVLFILQFATLTACKTHPHKREVANLLDDKVTTERVELALQQEGTGKFNQVKVSTSAGVVKLSGFVANSDAKKRAGEIAEEIHRANRVQNDLQIK